MYPSDEILSLGRKLISELDLENSVDTLARWMAHHVAELILKAETAKGRGKSAKTRECRDAILDLWKVRHELPMGRRPFEDFEAIFRALESLDPENTIPRYIRGGRPPATEKEGAPAAQWLNLVEGIDHSARVLIGYCLGKAAERSAGKAREWVDLAREDATNGQDIEIVRRIVTMSDQVGSEEPKDAERKMLQDRLNRIKAFQELVAVAETDLRKKLETRTRPTSRTKAKARKAKSPKGKR